jgi:hypothetical protein
LSTYPNYQQLRDSTVQIEGGYETARATNGALRVRQMWPVDKRTFEVGHVLTAEEWVALKAFYDTNRAADLAFTWQADAQTYTVRFLGPPQPRRLLRRWEVRLRLGEV